MRRAENFESAFVALSFLGAVAAMADAPETFTCSECGALYEVTRTNFPEPVEDCAECVECGCLMCEWSTTSVPLYRLIRTSDGRTPPEKPIA